MKITDKLKGLLDDSTAKATQLLKSSYDVVHAKVNELQIINSIQTSPTSSNAQSFDEKHYFLIPLKTSEHGFGLHSMRLLPHGVPPINDLPKKRIFHFPHSSCQHALENILLQGVNDYYSAGNSRESSTGNLLLDLANTIDKTEGKITNGLILIGGLVAIANPVVGVGIAAQALIPGIGGKLSKYGLTWAGEKLNQNTLNNEIAKAKSKVLEQFKDSETSYIENPILAQLQLAIDTDSHQYNPCDHPVNKISFNNEQLEKTIYITCEAILEVYKEIRSNKELQIQASVGPEDLAWFNYLQEEVTTYQEVMSSKELINWQASKTALLSRLTSHQNTTGIEQLHVLDNTIQRLAVVVHMDNRVGFAKHEVERIMFKTLPELIDFYLKIPESKLNTKLEGETKETAQTYFEKSFSLITAKLQSLSEDFYAMDVRDIRLLCEYVNLECGNNAPHL